MAEVFKLNDRMFTLFFEHLWVLTISKSGKASTFFSVGSNNMGDTKLIPTCGIKKD